MLLSNEPEVEFMLMAIYFITFIGDFVFFSQLFKV